jgi:hypothetical protein
MAATWRKSSKSIHRPEQCVEVALGTSVVRVRDSKNPTAAHLTPTEREWRSFLGAVKMGRYDG